MTDDNHRENVRDIIEEDRDILDELEDHMTRNEDVIERTRELVYDGDELISKDELDAALEDLGVVVGETNDGVAEYRNVPDDISLTAAMLSVDTGRDPADFVYTGDPSE